MYQDIDLERKAVNGLREFLERVSSLQIGEPEQPRLFGLLGPERPDFVLPIVAGNAQWHLICEIKRLGQPREVRFAALHLKEYIAALEDPHAYPMVIAPYISLRSAEICRQAGAGFLDFAGNCYIAFGNVFIERSGAPNPKAERRGLRSLFGAKSGRVLHVLLREPNRPWKVEELARAAGVSLGQVSNVRKALLDHEWASADSAGLRLIQPLAVLEAWRQAYKPQRQLKSRYYTLLHGEALEAAIKAALDEAGRGEHAVLSSFSAARWSAPYARQATTYFFADMSGEDILRRHLKLEPVDRGENVVIQPPRDTSVFSDRSEPVPGIWCASLIQTYLDLAVAGERGAEAAEHLLHERILPLWSTDS